MPTNGKRNAAASSHALKVGAQMPTRGAKASPTPADVPLSPLNSPYAVTALMNETPTSGPITTSITHQARDASSSRHSFRTNQPKAALREGKKHLFEIGAFGQAARLGDRSRARRSSLRPERGRHSAG